MDNSRKDNTISASILQSLTVRVAHPPRSRKCIYSRSKFCLYDCQVEPKCLYSDIDCSRCSVPDKECICMKPEGPGYKNYNNWERNHEVHLSEYEMRSKSNKRYQSCLYTAGRMCKRCRNTPVSDRSKTGVCKRCLRQK